MKGYEPSHFFAAALRAAVLPALLISAVSVTAQVTVDPPSIEITLNPGETHTEIKTVTIPGGATPVKVDVYFLADTTGSMGPVINSVKSAAGTLLTDLSSMISDIQFGVGEYKDFPFDAFCFRNNTSITSSAAAVTAGINLWAAGGGSDGPEGQFFALDRIADPGDPFGIGFRPGAQKIIVWFGDAPGHDPVCAAISGLGLNITEATLTAKLVAGGFTVVAVGTTTGYPQALNDDPVATSFDYSPPCIVGGAPGQATRIAMATSGVSLQGVTPATIVDAILDAIAAVTADVTVALSPTGETAPFTMVLTPPYVDVPLPPEGEDLVLTFEVKFTGQDCDPVLTKHDFHGGVDVLVDGGVAATQTVTIHQPLCDDIPRTSTSAKGSLLIYPKVEVRWDSAGNLIQDTMIQITSDYNLQPVHVVTYFVSEDCAKLYADFDLTKNQPVWFAASSGLPLGVAPLTALAGALKTDPLTGDRYIRGYFVCFAADDANRQIRFNHLSGLATIVRYDEADAYEYSPYAFQALIGMTGAVVGTPGQIVMDGSQYESGFNRLLLEFMATGAGAFSGGGRSIIHDTIVALLIQNIDVRQEYVRHCTKAFYTIYNQNELSFAEEYCFCCWSCVRLGDIGGLFLVENLQTDRGRALIDGIASPTVCDKFDPLDPFKPKSTDEPLLGVSIKELTYTGSGRVARAASTLAGTGNETATFLFDLPGPVEEKGNVGGPRKVGSMPGKK